MGHIRTHTRAGEARFTKHTLLSINVSSDRYSNSYKSTLDFKGCKLVIRFDFCPPSSAMFIICCSRFELKMVIKYYNRFYLITMVHVATNATNRFNGIHIWNLLPSYLIGIHHYRYLRSS